MFKHNICGDQPKVPNGMPNSSDPLPPEFALNPKCPSTPIATEATTTKADLSEEAKELEKSASAGDFDGAS